MSTRNPMPSRIDIDLQRVKQRIENGETLSAIASSSYCAISLLSNRLQESNFSIAKIKQDKAIELFLTGSPIWEIMQIFNWSDRHVRRILAENNISATPRCKCGSRIKVNKLGDRLSLCNKCWRRTPDGIAYQTALVRKCRYNKLVNNK